MHRILLMVIIALIIRDRENWVTARNLNKTSTTLFFAEFLPKLESASLSEKGSLLCRDFDCEHFLGK
jgi:hypothetical protein